MPSSAQIHMTDVLTVPDLFSLTNRTCGIVWFKSLGYAYFLRWYGLKGIPTIYYGHPRGNPLEIPVSDPQEFPNLKSVIGTIPINEDAADGLVFPDGPMLCYDIIFDKDPVGIIVLKREPDSLTDKEYAD